MILNNKEKIKEIDTGYVSESIEALPEQIQQMLGEMDDIDIPKEYGDVTEVVISGMGGSNLGARIIKSVFKDKLEVPIIINPGYVVPAFVNENTLYVVSSYSGTTEEPLSTYEEAKKRGAKILGITADNEKSQIKKWMQEDGLKGVAFNPKVNPSNQPRLGVGYTIFGTMIMLAKTGILKIDKQEMEEIVEFLKEKNNDLKIDTSSEEGNVAKKIAQEMFGKNLILVSADFLEGNTHTMRNQVSESSKNLASYLILPELNHYSMEGLGHPEGTAENYLFVFFDSEFNHKRNQIRSKLSKEVVKKNGINVTSHLLTGDTKLKQSFEMLQLGSWITYYLGILNEVDPVKIPWVDWFKDELKKE